MRYYHWGYYLFADESCHMYLEVASLIIIFFVWTLIESVFLEVSFGVN